MISLTEKENLKSHALSRSKNTQQQNALYYQAIHELLLELETDTVLSIKQKEDIWFLTNKLCLSILEISTYITDTFKILNAHQQSQATLLLCSGLLLGLGTTVCSNRFSLFNLSISSIFFTAIIHEGIKQFESNIPKKLLKIESTAKNQTLLIIEQVLPYTDDTTTQNVTDKTHPSNSKNSLSKADKKMQQIAKDAARGLFFKPKTSSAEAEILLDVADKLTDKFIGHKLFTPNITGTGIEKNIRRALASCKLW